MLFWTSLTLYRESKDTFENNFYLQKMNDRTYRNISEKFCLSSYGLAVEMSRHRNIEHRARKCYFCTPDGTEDEYHFVFIYPYYND